MYLSTSFTTGYHFAGTPTSVAMAKLKIWSKAAANSALSCWGSKLLIYNLWMVLV